VLKKGPLLVLGGINMDFVVRSKTFPKPGQTLLGYNFRRIAGGKGAGQAVGIARLRGRYNIRTFWQSIVDQIEIPIFDIPLQKT